MKRLLLIVLVFITVSAKAQFTGTDSLRNYNNRYVTTNPATAFTNNRLNTLLRGIIDFIDTARAGGGGAIQLGIDTVFAVNDSTIRYRKNGVFRQFTLKGVYDSRRKVDTIYKSNDTTLTFTINGNLRTVIIPGGTNLNLATANQTATGNRTHNWDNYWLFLNNLKAFGIYQDQPDANHANNNFKTQITTDSSIDGTPLQLMWGLRNINDDIIDSVHFELTSKDSSTYLHHWGADTSKSVKLSLNGNSPTTDIRMDIASSSKVSTYKFGHVASIEPADSIRLKMASTSATSKIIGARAESGGIWTPVVIDIPTSGVTALNNIGTGYNLVATPGGNIKRINNSYGILIDSTTTANTITVQADTSSTNSLVTKSDLNDAIAGAGSGISGLTAGRVTLSTSATTVGDDAGLTYDGATNKVTTDSVSILKARSDVYSFKWGFKADSANAFGNSITFGANASPVDSAYPNRIADTLNVPLHNYAVAGTGIYAITASALLHMSVMHNGVTIFNGGFNTLRNNNILSGLSGRKTQNAIIWGYKSAFANHFLKSYVGVSDASVTRVGTWFTDWDATAATGKAINGAFTMQTGAYFEKPFTDSTIVITFLGQNDAVQAGSTYDIYIDNVLYLSGSTSNKADGIYDGHSDNGNHMAMAEIITGLSYGSHTVKVEHTGSGVLICDYIGHLRPARNSPQLLMYQIPYMKGAGYVGGASSIARTDTMNLRLDSLYTTFPTAYKEYAHLLETKTLYDTATGTDSDDIHPNNTGHGQLAQLAYPYILASNYDPGSLYATENGLYYKDNAGDYKVILGEGTTGYLPIFNATNRQMNSIIRSDGTNVGVGQAPATYKFSVAGSLRNTTDAYFATSSGNVGIGTTSPTTKLDVNGSGNFQGSVTSRGAAAGYAFESRSSGTYAWVIFADNNSCKFYAAPDGYERVKFWRRGGVTIAHATEVSVTDMGATLDVHGSIRIDKDSVRQEGSITSESVILLDTVTNVVKRISASALGGGVSGTTDQLAFFNSSNTATSNYTMQRVATSDGEGLEIQNNGTGVGAANGAVFNLYLNNASPTGTDRVGEFHFFGNNSSAAKKQLAAIYANADGITAGAENGAQYMNITVNGSINQYFEAKKASLGAGGVQLRLANKFLVDEDNGSVTMGNMIDPSAYFQYGNSLNGRLYGGFVNSSTGSSAYAEWGVGSGSGGLSGTETISMLRFGNNWSSVGAYKQAGGVIRAGDNITGGLSIMSTAANGRIRFYTGSYVDDSLRLVIGRVDSTASATGGFLYQDAATKEVRRTSGTATLKGSTTWDPPSVGGNSSTTTTISVTGAALGDPVTISKTSGSYSNGEIYYAYVSATNTVTIQLHNGSGGSFDIASATFNVIVLKY